MIEFIGDLSKNRAKKSGADKFTIALQTNSLSTTTSGKILPDTGNGYRLIIMSNEANSAIFAGLSFLVAAWALRWQTNEQKHRYLLDQATQSLERAYDALTEGAPTRDGTPVANRLNWLTAARHLERYRAMKRDVKLPLYRLMCEENEEHWRHQFYLCVNRQTICRADYYADNGQEGRDGIEPTSAYLVHSFATWPEGKPDPIQDVDLVSRQKESDPLSANIGLRFYLESFAHTRHLTEQDRPRPDGHTQVQSTNPVW